MDYNDYSPEFQLVRRVVWAEEEAERLAKDLYDMQSTARDLLKYAKQQNLEDHVRTYRQFRNRCN